MDHRRIFWLNFILYHQDIKIEMGQRHTHWQKWCDIFNFNVTMAHGASHSQSLCGRLDCSYIAAVNPPFNDLLGFPLRCCQTCLFVSYWLLPHIGYSKIVQQWQMDEFVSEKLSIPKKKFAELGIKPAIKIYLFLFLKFVLIFMHDGMVFHS